MSSSTLKNAAQASAAARTEEFAVTPAIRRAAELAERYAHRDGIGLLRLLIEREFAGRLAVDSSFGTESAVILAHSAEIDQDTPIPFLDTCTDRVRLGEEPRAGRWRGLPKTECWIHASNRRRTAS